MKTKHSHRADEECNETCVTTITDRDWVLKVIALERRARSLERRVEVLERESSAGWPKRIGGGA